MIQVRQAPGTTIFTSSMVPSGLGIYRTLVMNSDLVILAPGPRVGQVQCKPVRGRASCKNDGFVMTCRVETNEFLYLMVCFRGQTIVKLNCCGQVPAREALYGHRAGPPLFRAKTKSESMIYYKFNTSFSL